MGANVLEMVIGRESNAFLVLNSFTKTNGQKSLINGVDYYSMEYQVVVVAVESCALTGFQFGKWNGSYSTAIIKQNATELDKFNPADGNYAGYKIINSGKTFTFTSKLEFEKTEKGWRTRGIIPEDKPLTSREGAVAYATGLIAAAKARELEQQKIAQKAEQDRQAVMKKFFPKGSDDYQPLLTKYYLDETGKNDYSI